LVVFSTPRFTIAQSEAVAAAFAADNPEDERLQKSSWLHLILLSESTRHRTA